MHPNSSTSATTIRALKALNIVAKSDQPISAQQLADIMKIDRIAAYRSLVSLVEVGFVYRCSYTGKYKPSLNLLSFFPNFLTASIRQNLIAETTQSIADKTAETCYFHITEEDETVVTFRALGTSSRAPGEKVESGFSLNRRDHQRI